MNRLRLQTCPFQNRPRMNEKMALNDQFGFKRIAHRGASGEAPENTVPAIRLAVEKYEVDGIEVDLRIAKDGVPVLFHDADLERITPGRGPVSRHSTAELKTFDAGFWFDPEGKGVFPYRGKGVVIPTLEEVLGEFPETNFYLEIKEKEIEAVEKILDVIHRLPRRGSVVIGSFHGKIAREIRRSCPPSIESILSQGEVVQAHLAFRLGFRKFSLPSRFAFLPPSQYGIRLDHAPWVEFLHRKGVRVFYWTVNEAEAMKTLVRRGADGILTDYPGRLNNVLKGDGSERDRSEVSNGS